MTKKQARAKRYQRAKRNLIWSNVMPIEELMYRLMPKNSMIAFGTEPDKGTIITKE